MFAVSTFERMLFLKPGSQTRIVDRSAAAFEVDFPDNLRTHNARALSGLR